MRTKDCIVSFSSKGREPYNAMLLRLIDSALEHWKGDILVYSPDHPSHEYRGTTIHKGYPKPLGVKSFTHQEMPYQFKTAMIQLALEQGYERIIWLDSSLQLLKNPIKLIEESENGIVTFENLGHPLWKYISDDAKHKLLLAESTLELIPQIWGGVFMLDFNHSTADYFFERLKEFSLNGSFKDGKSNREGFVAHRHDQAVMSVLSYGISDLQPYGKIVCHPHELTGEYGTDNYILYKGL